MSNKQFKSLLYFAGGFLLGNILIWGFYGLYLILVGRT